MNKVASRCAWSLRERWNALAVLTFVLAAFANTLFPGEGLSNLILFSFMLFLGQTVLDRRLFLAVFFGSVFVLVFGALTGMHGVNSRDVSCAIALSFSVAFVLAPFRRSHRFSREAISTLCAMSNSVLVAIGILVLSLGSAEFIYSLVDFNFRACTAFPRASAPLRLDSFGLGGVPGCAYDSNNLGAVAGFILAGVSGGMGFLLVLLTSVGVVVITGSRSLLLAVFALLAKRKVLGLLLFLVVSAPVVYIAIDSDFVSLYAGRIDFSGAVEGSFVDRASVVTDSLNQVGFLPPSDETWERYESGVSYRSVYNGFIATALRFGVLPVGLLLIGVGLVFLKQRALRTLLLVWLIFNMTGEFMFNAFCVYAFCLSAIHLRVVKNLQKISRIRAKGWSKVCGV